MSKNIVFIPSIDLGNGRNKSYKYSLDSWKHFCKNNDAQLVLLKELLAPITQIPIVWQ